jgi:UDP-N-acetyl-D-galactosamine dehydrogenase
MIVSVIGLGYVGLPLAVSFAKHFTVIGFDSNSAKIAKYIDGIDPTHEIGGDALKDTTVQFTSDAKTLRQAIFHIVAVPTPIRDDNIPDLTCIESASRTVGKNLTKGSIVVYESTVYPGVTEDICVPILENASGLKCGADFKVGYSPERINPGDKLHRLENIVKVVSGMDADSRDTIANVYSKVIKAGVHAAPSIKIAEAAKVIENAQRDINIAFVNELSLIFNRMNIDTSEVLKAAGTKWNFLKFSPGLVGGHCIGVDPYYLTYQAERFGYHPDVILSGRRINDNMGKYIAENTVKQLIKLGKAVNGTKVAIFGFTFKENCPDTRNSKVYDIYKELLEYGITTLVYDPVADSEDTFAHYDIKLCAESELNDLDAIILAVSHNEFCGDASKYAAYFQSGSGVIIDVKSILKKQEVLDNGLAYWGL